MAGPPSGVYTKLRARLIERRQELGLTQIAVAAAMHVTQSALSDLESGRVADPRLSTVVRWAAAVRYRVGIQLIEEIVHTITLGPDDDGGEAA